MCYCRLTRFDTNTTSGGYILVGRDNAARSRLRYLHCDIRALSTLCSNFDGEFAWTLRSDRCQQKGILGKSSVVAAVNRTHATVGIVGPLQSHDCGCATQISRQLKRNPRDALQTYNMADVNNKLSLAFPLSFGLCTTSPLWPSCLWN